MLNNIHISAILYHENENENENVIFFFSFSSHNIFLGELRRVVYVQIFFRLEG